MAHGESWAYFQNHSCYPNIQIVQAYVDDFHPERPLYVLKNLVTRLTDRRLVIFSLYDVEAGQELCISYKGLPVSQTLTLCDESYLISTGRRGRSRGQN